VSWERPQDAAARLREINAYYAKLRPMMSGAAFLNYADRDLADPARAYWGRNLERLIEIKRRYDPNNLFRHALSVPIGSGRLHVDALTCA
jgi:FAD/FMN-containing dehydrogenase